MSDFKFDHIYPLKDRTILQNGFFLWIWYADKIPPHIGCSIDGAYFNLKVNGKEMSLKSEKILPLIETKKIPTLFIKVKTTIRLSDLLDVYSHYQKAETGKSTCLSPITELFACSSVIFQLSELLKHLASEDKLETVFGLNLADGYSSLPAYTTEDIENRLRKLENVKSEKHISPIR
jgi:hypothetical protein